MLVLESLEASPGSSQSVQPREREITVTPRHGQRQSHLADQQHAVPGQDGEMAALQVYRGVSCSIFYIDWRGEARVCV